MLGCATIGTSPAWVEGEPAGEYPASRYWTAVGSGESLESARAAATSELSRMFSAAVSAETRRIRAETIPDSIDDTIARRLLGTRSPGEAELDGSEAPLQWQEPETGRIWALAVLDRDRECQRVRSEAGDLVRRLEAATAEVQGQPHPLAAIRATRQAAKLGLELDGWQARSRALGRDCVEGRSVSTARLLTDLDERMGDLSFVVNAREVDSRSGVSRGPLPQLRERIASELTDLGFRVGPVAGAAERIAVEARLRLDRMETDPDRVEFRWQGSAEIGSVEPGEEPILVVEEEGVESHPDASTANLRARQDGEQTLSDRLARLLEQFLETSRAS
jgi:hypothetical protein